MRRPPPAGRTGAGRRSRTRTAGLSRAPAGRRGGLAVVYDVDGPRVRLGVVWFAVALAGVAADPAGAALVYSVAAGWAARQVVRAWGSTPWQADLATALGAAPVLAALAGLQAAVAALGVAVLVAVFAAAAPGGARYVGWGGRIAALGICWLAIVPSVGAAAVVLVRSESMAAAVLLLLLVSAYEMGDFVVGSGASNPIEGPLAGMATASLIGFPLALLLVDPFDVAGVSLLGFVAVACPLGQILGSALLPAAGAPAAALRRIDTLIVAAPLWAAASLTL